MSKPFVNALAFSIMALWSHNSASFTQQNPPPPSTNPNATFGDAYAEADNDSKCLAQKLGLKDDNTEHIIFDGKNVLGDILGDRYSVTTEDKGADVSHDVMVGSPNKEGTRIVRFYVSAEEHTESAPSGHFFSMVEADTKVSNTGTVLVTHVKVDRHPTDALSVFASNTIMQLAKAAKECSLVDVQFDIDGNFVPTPQSKTLARPNNHHKKRTLAPEKH